MSELHDLTAGELLDRLRAAAVSPVEAVAHYVERIARLDGRLGAFVEVTADAALARAARLEAAAPFGTLWGLPHAEKDLVARAGVPTRYGSAARIDHVPAASDELALLLDAAGAVSVGKTNTPEFGLTGYTESAVAPPARDPWDTRNGAGGSSGGAAAAVAAGLLPAAIGSDGGGSVRIPAATVGIVGLKPSRGRLPVGSGLDSPGGLVVNGPLARTVGDAALLLDALVAGAPYRHATRAAGAGPFVDAVRTDGPALRVAVTTVSPWDDDEDIRLDAAAAAAVSTAAAVLDGLGHAVAELAWRPHGYAALFRVLWRSSAARLPLTDAELARLQPITAWLVREGRALGAPELLGALSAASAFERETIAVFAPYDAVLTPALALPARPVGWFDAADPERDFAQQVRYAPYSSFVNVAGLPAIVVPVTRDAAGHPVAVQLVGRPGGEAALLRLAGQLESARGPLPHPPCW
ncbi:MAG: amidase [Microbacterium sp.]|uniref:amidase n=1 Tax=Microbacterium sp. TaxID=51671 RepID=UPI0039E6596E